MMYILTEINMFEVNQLCDFVTMFDLLTCFTEVH